MLAKLSHFPTPFFIHCSKHTCFQNPIHHKLNFTQCGVSMDFNLLLSNHCCCGLGWYLCSQCLRRVKGLSQLIGHFKYLLTYCAFICGYHNSGSTFKIDCFLCDCNFLGLGFLGSHWPGLTVLNMRWPGSAGFGRVCQPWPCLADFGRVNWPGLAMFGYF